MENRITPKSETARQAISYILGCKFVAFVSDKGNLGLSTESDYVNWQP